MSVSADDLLHPGGAGLMIFQPLDTYYISEHT